MPQYFATLTTKNPAGTLVPTNADAAGNLLTSSGGVSSALNVTAPTVVKAAPGRVSKVVVMGTPGSGGAFTLNDCTTTGAASAANEICAVPGTLAVGTVLTLDWPCAAGIVVSGVPTGGTPLFALSFT